MGLEEGPHGRVRGYRVALRAKRLSDGGRHRGTTRPFVALAGDGVELDGGPAVQAWYSVKMYPFPLTVRGAAAWQPSLTAHRSAATGTEYVQ